MRAANLAGRPFRNERLPNLLTAAAAVVLVALTVRHALLVRGLLPGRTSALHDEVARLEAESASLRSEQERLRGVNPEPKALARWLVVKDLVDRRAFSWTGLFARLENRIPEGARVVSIAPTVRRGDILIDLTAVMRSPEVGWEFMRALDAGGDFADVFPLSEGENGEFHYSMRFRPRPAGAASSSPAPAPSPAALPSGTTAAGALPARPAEVLP
jgi:Tfp pilus assembly protein PilN